MDRENLHSSLKNTADLRLCDVCGHTTECLEIQADNPKMHVLLIPGNPGVVPFYKDFVESLFELLGGNASVTAIGHTAHTRKDWDKGRLFSLQEQIDHKVDFIRKELEHSDVPTVLVGHSIGAYISLEVLRRCAEKVVYYIGLYPFLAVDLQSEAQSKVSKIAASPFLSAAVSFMISSIGLLPRQASQYIVRNIIGKKWSWSDTAVDAACTHLLQYHTMRNVLFMTMTEFEKLAETPDWAFMSKLEDRIAFLFGIDDHWGPLEMLEEISKQVPGIPLSIEREGHTHSFSCTKAGSLWVAQHVATLIYNRLSSSS